METIWPSLTNEGPRSIATRRTRSGREMRVRSSSPRLASDSATGSSTAPTRSRKTGDPAASLPLYQKALAIDPKHEGAHEYIGEAYLMLDNLPKAKEHLGTLNSLCMITCGEYRDLKRAVEAYEKTGGKSKPTAASN